MEIFKASRGTTDVLPQEQAYWRFIEQNVVNICQRYGYERLDTPTFEDTRLFTRSVGEDTDIVEKQMYTFKDKGGNLVTLRPEGTASVCRAYIEHGMHNLPQPVRLYYLTSVFRYERPQAGRLRQHSQFGCEAIGESDPGLDAEIIDITTQFLYSLGLKNLALQLNSIGCKECRPDYIDAVKEYYTSYRNVLCSDCKRRLLTNPLRLLDCKETDCQRLIDSAPKSVDYLCSDCAGHYHQLREYLTLLEISFQENHRLVRGLDYYTRTVFEIQPEKTGSQNTICGGGRYDGLIRELGGRSTPAIGFASGIERIILNLKEQNITVPPLSRTKVFVTYVNANTKYEAIKITASLRKKGINAIQALGNKSLKAQLRQSNKLKVPYNIIVGDQEYKKGTVIVRNMITSEQEVVSIGDLPKALK